MISVVECKDRQAWEEERKGTIGGSDAAALIGKSPYMSNVDLWEIKTGRKQAADLSENELVQYGHDAEPLLRELFRIDHRGEYKVRHSENTMIVNDKYPFAHASVDGLLIRKSDNALGILEIKTATIQSAAQNAKWKDGVPINYLIQCLWYMGITGATFAIIDAQLKQTDRSGSEYKITKEYMIDRTDYEKDIGYLMLKGETFWKYVTEDRRPPLLFEI